MLARRRRFFEPLVDDDDSTTGEEAAIAQGSALTNEAWDDAMEPMNLEDRVDTGLPLFGRAQP